MAERCSKAEAALAEQQRQQEAKASGDGKSAQADKAASSDFDRLGAAGAGEAGSPSELETVRSELTAAKEALQAAEANARRKEEALVDLQAQLKQYQADVDRQFSAMNEEIARLQAKGQESGDATKAMEEKSAAEVKAAVAAAEKASAELSEAKQQLATTAAEIAAAAREKEELSALLQEKDAAAAQVTAEAQQAVTELHSQLEAAKAEVRIVFVDWCLVLLS